MRPLSQLLVVFNQLSLSTHKKVSTYFLEGHTENSLKLTKSVNGSKKWKIKTELVGFGMLWNIRRIFASRIFKRWGVAPPPLLHRVQGPQGAEGRESAVAANDKRGGYHRHELYLHLSAVEEI